MGFEWLFALGLHLSVPEQLNPDHGYSAELGREPAYLFAAYDSNRYRSPLGSNLGSLRQITAGAGFTVNAGAFQLKLEAGKVFVSANPKPIIRNEYIRASLRHDFGEPPFTPSAYSMSIGNAVVVAVGLEVPVTQRIGLIARYRWARAKEKLDMWTGIRHDYKKNEPDCRCWWQQTNHVDLSAVQIGLRVQL